MQLIRDAMAQRAYWNAQVCELQGHLDGFKHRLARLLQHELAPDLLQQAELFQNTLLNKEAVVGIIRHDLAISRSFDDALPSDLYMIRPEEALRQDLDKLEQELAGMNGQLIAIEHAAKES